MPLTEGQKQSMYNYAKKTLKRIPLDVRKEKYEDIKAAADIAGESVNHYIKKAIDERMERDGFTTDKNPRSTKAPTLKELSQTDEPSKTLREQSRPVPTLKELSERTTTPQPIPKSTGLPEYLAPTVEDKVDLDRLLTDISYQFTVRDVFGEDGLARLLEKARQAK